MFTARPIKASQLKMDPVRLEILNALRKEGRAEVRELNKTVVTWKNKPKFEFKISLKQRTQLASVQSFPTGDKDAVQVWWWMNDGTEEHDIEPKQPGVYPLRFVWDGPGSYQAKTEPRVVGSSSGGATGNVVFFHKVRHPGTEAREWTEVILNERRKPFTALMVEAVQRGLARAKK